MTEGKDNLELYLSDVYEKECVFKINKDEVDFIQRAIETLVPRLADKILVYDPIWDEIEQDFALFRSEGGKITRCRSGIIKVGSFYEGTKNDFPCEFDLIYPFYYCEETKCMDPSLKEILQRILCRTYQLVYHTGVLHKTDGKKDLFYDSPDGVRKLYFDRYIGRSRPAITMNFIYESNTGLHKEINVDLVPAAIIKDSNLGEIVNKYCALAPFGIQVISMGRVLMVDRRITFTETEVHIMRDVSSQNHRKVYRILKFLINGNGNGDAQIKISSEIPIKGYSSYMIKTMMIYHHFKCKNPETEGLGPCMLEVLNEMCTHRQDKTFPRLLKGSKTFERQKRLFLLQDLQDMTNSLMLMQKSNESYDYERDRRKKSLSENYVYDHYRRVRTDDDLDSDELEKVSEIADFLLNFGN